MDYFSAADDTDDADLLAAQLKRTASSVSSAAERCHYPNGNLPVREALGSAQNRLVMNGMRNVLFRRGLHGLHGFWAARLFNP